VSKYVNKYKSKSRVDRDQSRIIDTPVANPVTLGSVIDVISQNGRSIGDILVAVKNEDGTFTNKVASCMSPHFISLPLPNERVSLIKDSTTGKWYYMTSLSNRGFVNHMGNAAKRVFQQDTSDLYHGKTFIPSPALRSLNIHEGDTIIQGRSGQSIRFGSKWESVNTPWNADSDEGLPIIAIRSGVSQIENLDTDFSSIYLTSGQTLPIVLKSQIPSSYTKPDLYNENQIVVTSDRLMLYSQEDSIILSSAKDVGISTDKWAIDVTTLVDQLTELSTLVIQLSEQVYQQGLNSATSTHIGNLGAPTSPPSNAPNFSQIATQASTIKSQLQQVKNKLDNMKQ
jgi:hypothetical protein